MDIPSRYLDPGHIDPQLQVGISRIELHQHANRDAKGDQGGDQRRPAGCILLLRLQEEEHQHAHQGEEGDQGQGLYENSS